MFHGGCGSALLGSRYIHRQEVTLDECVVHGLGCTARNNKILLRDKPFLDSLSLVVTAMSSGVRHIDAAVHKVVPAKYLFCPKLEGIQQFQVATIGKGQLVLAELYKTLDRLIVIVDAWVCNQVVDPIHLHGDFSAYRNFTPNHGLSKPAIVNRRGRV